MTNQTSLQIVCPACKALNRVASQKLGDKPLCGKCRQPLLTNSPVSLDDRQFARWISKSDMPVLVDFWAPWCGPCVQFAPVFEQVAGDMATRCSFVKLDTQANQSTAGQWQIRSIPTLMLFDKGIEVARLSGALPKSQFVAWVEQQLAIL